MKNIVKFIIKIICVVIVLCAWHKLSENGILELDEFGSYVEKILICVIAYGIHRLVEWCSGKLFPADQEKSEEVIHGISKDKLNLLLESLDENQFLWFAEKKQRNACCILTLDERLFKPVSRKKDRWVGDSMLLELKNSKSVPGGISLFLTFADSEETLVKNVKKQLPRYSISDTHSVHALAGDVSVRIWSCEKADKDDMVFFCCKVDEGLYFEGYFYLSKNSEFNADGIVAAIFQKTECC